MIKHSKGYLEAKRQEARQAKTKAIKYQIDLILIGFITGFALAVILINYLNK